MCGAPSRGDFQQPPPLARTAEQVASPAIQLLFAEPPARAPVCLPPPPPPQTAAYILFQVDYQDATDKSLCPGLAREVPASVVGPGGNIFHLLAYGGHNFEIPHCVVRGVHGMANEVW